MCQPGRPCPHGESHEGSPGLADFHKTKSIGSSLRVSTSTRAPAGRGTVQVRPADVQRDVGRLARLKFFFLTREGVVNSEGHYINSFTLALAVTSMMGQPSGCATSPRWRTRRALKRRARVLG